MGKRYSSPAVEQASQILFCLANNPGPQMGLAEICSHLGISGSKAHSILEALQKSGLIKRGKDGKGYSLDLGLVTLSRKVIDDLEPSKLAEPVLKKLTAKSGASSMFGIIIGENIYTAAKRDSKGDIRIEMRIGRIWPLTYGAHGKAIVAYLPEAERENILKDKDLYFYGSSGKFDRARLKEELVQCRRDGFACDLGESNEGIDVVAAPVTGVEGTPVGFVEICVLSSPKRAREHGPAVVEAGKALSRELGANTA